VAQTKASFALSSTVDEYAAVMEQTLVTMYRRTFGWPESAFTRRYALFQWMEEVWLWRQSVGLSWGRVHDKLSEAHREFKILAGGLKRLPLPGTKR